MRSVDDIYITDARTVRPYKLGEYTTVQGEILCHLFNLVDNGDCGFYVEIIDI